MNFFYISFVFLTTALVFGASSKSIAPGFDLSSEFSVLPEFPHSLQFDDLKFSKKDWWTGEHWNFQANASLVGLDRLTATLTGPWLCGTSRDDEYRLFLHVPKVVIRGRVDLDVRELSCLSIVCFTNEYIGAGDYEVVFGDDEESDVIEMHPYIREDPKTGLVDVYKMDRWHSASDLWERASYDNFTGTWEENVRDNEPLPMDEKHFRRWAVYDGWQNIVEQFTPALRKILQESLKGLTIAQLHQFTGGCPEV